MSDKVLCIGEILWDALPSGLFLGGAPFNVASHLRVLGKDVMFVSRVGTDFLGDEALRRVQARGLDTDLIQVDESRPTGFVRVDLNDPDDPDYEIVEPAAWDAIQSTEQLKARAETAEALVYGSLAQRAETSRATIRVLCESNVLRVFDVNLRSPFFTQSRIEHSLHNADVVKLNHEELRQLRSWFGLPSDPGSAMAAVANRFNCRAVCVTWGGDGARLWMDGHCWRHSSYSVDVEDTVGAGDAFLAAFLSGWLEGRDGGSLLELANRLGAYVAAHAGAVPPYSVDSLTGVSDLRLPSPPEPS